MQVMHKTILAISLAAGLSWITIADAKPLPFIDANQIITHTTTTPTKVKKKSYAQYVRENAIDLSYGGLKDSDMPALITFLNNHPEITEVNLDGNDQLTAEGIVPLASVQTITDLNLSRHNRDCTNGKCIGGLEAKDISAFSNNKSLIRLNLNLHTIGDDGAIELAKNTRLKRLELFSNDITDKGGVALATNPSLEELSLNANDKIGSQTAVALANHPSLKKLYLGQTSVDDEGVIAIAKQSQIDELNLHYMDIGDAAAVALANNSYLKNLQISGTNVGIVGAKALAHSKSIEKLGLGGNLFGEPRPNDIGDEGAIALSQDLNLQVLELSSQQITAAGVAELAKNNRIYSLSLGGNRKIGDEGAAALTKAHLLNLNVSACRLTDKGAVELAKNPRFFLYANSNFISDIGATALAKNNNLISLALVVNEIHDEGAFAFLNYAYMHHLMLEMNRMTALGVTMINNRDGWGAGGENPFPPRVKAGSDHFPRILETNQPISATTMVCYRTQGKIGCTDKQNIIFDPRG